MAGLARRPGKRGGPVQICCVGDVGPHGQILDGRPDLHGHLSENYVAHHGVTVVHDHAQDGRQLARRNMSSVLLGEDGMLGIGDVLHDQRDDAFLLKS